MRFTIALWLTFMFLLAEVPAQDAKKDAEKLQGKWVVIAMTMNGKESPKEKNEGLQVVFNDDKMTLLRVKTGKGQDYLFKLDPKNKPRAIDLEIVDGKLKGHLIRGIYQFEEETLKLCLSNTTGNDRPKEFQALEKSDLFVMTLTRAKK